MNIVGIGSHIVECLRIAQLIERHGDQFLRRVFTPREIEFCNARNAATQHFAAHWAGKEAAVQALRGGGEHPIRWLEIEVRCGGGEATHVALGGSMRRLCEQRGIARLSVSIAHCRTHATGYAMALAGEDEFDDL